MNRCVCGVQVQYLTEVMKADGGVIITSSHNPEPWNGAHARRDTHHIGG